MLTQKEEGWRQIQAGISLVGWSRLARWSSSSLSFAPTTASAFESAAGHREVHPAYGRLICWITFAVGFEYLCKGVCLLMGYHCLSGKTVTRPPEPGEDIGKWIQLVKDKDLSVAQQDQSSQTLGQLHPEKILQPGRDHDLVYAGVKLMAETMRNRDAHRYVENVRSAHFSVVGLLFVPCLNTLLATVDTDELRRRCPG